MNEMFGVMATESGPRFLRFVSQSGVDFRRIGQDLAYFAPGALKLVDDDMVASVTGRPIGRLGTWVRYCGLRIFFTLDTLSAENAAQTIRDALESEAA